MSLPTILLRMIRTVLEDPALQKLICVDLSFDHSYVELSYEFNTERQHGRVYYDEDNNMQYQNCKCCPLITELFKGIANAPTIITKEDIEDAMNLNPFEPADLSFLRRKC